nr:hypothetical protein CFP56_69952 [Quercus suber]
MSGSPLNQPIHSISRLQAPLTLLLSMGSLSLGSHQMKSSTWMLTHQLGKPQIKPQIFQALQPSSLVPEHHQAPQTLLSPLLHLNPTMSWAIWINNHAVELSNSMINNIRWDPLMIYGWTDKDLLNSWSFIFPLTEQSKRGGCLPLTHLAWHNTLNPWWRFSLDQPPLLPLGQRTSSTSWDRFQSNLLEILLYLLEIFLRMFLTSETIGVLIQWTLPQLKLIQTLSFMESFTLGTVMRQT